MKTKFLLIVVFLVLVGGCQERLTKKEWLERLPPPQTLEEGQAQAHLQTQLKLAEEKIRNMAMSEKVKLACVAGIIASIFAIILGTKGVKAFGIAGFVACIVGIALIQVSTNYPKWFAYGGAMIALPAGVYAIWIIVRAMKQMVVTTELAKKKLTIPDRIYLFGKDSVSDGRIKTEVQSPTTTKLVASIRKKLP